MCRRAVTIARKSDSSKELASALCARSGGKLAKPTRKPDARRTQQEHNGRRLLSTAIWGDMVYILRDDKPGPASPRELAIERVIAENELSVETIMQTWLLEKADQLTPYARLSENLRLAKERDDRK